jgi:hypothetical protein
VAIVLFDRPTDRLDELRAGQGSVRFIESRELYLGDPQRSAPERLPTVLRHPVG